VCACAFADNEGQEAINTILDASAKSEDVKVAEQVYDISCGALEKSSGGGFSRRLFDVRMKLCKTQQSRGASAEAANVCALPPSPPSSMRLTSPHL
jgi:hypothetical protein